MIDWVVLYYKLCDQTMLFKQLIQAFSFYLIKKIS